MNHDLICADPVTSALRKVSGSKALRFTKKIGIRAFLLVLVAGFSTILSSSPSRVEASRLLPSPSVFTIPPAPQSGDFVYRQGTKFYLNGQGFHFVGFDYFNAAGNQQFSCLQAPMSDSDMDAMFKYWIANAGATVMRFTATQEFTAGGTDWSGFDRILKIASANGIHVLPWLEDNDGYCTVWGNQGPPLWYYRNGEWWANAQNPSYLYFSPPYQYPLSFYDYVARVVTRYKDDPTILAWMIINEGEFSTHSDVETIADTYSTLIKSLDPNHMVTYGSRSMGGPGLSDLGGQNSEFVQVYGLPNIDFVEGHDWSHLDHNPLPGSLDGVHLPDPNTCGYATSPTKGNNGSLACSMALAFTFLNKPFMIGESGIKAGPGYKYTYAQRAPLLDAKMHASFNVGLSGYLIWEWNTYQNQGYSVLEGDPVLPLMKKYSQPSE